MKPYENAIEIDPTDVISVRINDFGADRFSN